ncbi:glycoside hydrolase family 13 protein [Citricoccus muralis]|uniref:Glycoside hydrolase family 13 protein n=1 Tax=Citricoccus muralis TaxID=169134 RepID=A0ABY8H6W1_9MICC|nr:glycoside hydrolase family 13 protein [Citricoccus muralis]WFP16875.1 glycoside hydrolase family 13 protein [Citricoccus muralis]
MTPAPHHAPSSVPSSAAHTGQPAPLSTPPSEARNRPSNPWWVDAVIYQVYPRSFADGNGDGMGDLPGVIAQVPYLQRLGVDALWLSPFYVSPQHDAGYDVADYRNVDPRFGTLADADELISTAHDAGLRIIVDLVPNHTSWDHEWFVEALAAEPGSPARNRYVFRPGTGDNGELPPNDWSSIFGGPAWTRTENPDGTPGEWYLHLFDTSQPDLNWENPEVHAEFESILRFWLDRGVDGFRVDVAHGMIKAEGLPPYAGFANMVKDAGDLPEFIDRENFVPPTPYFDQDGVHEIYREWNRVLAEYDHEPCLVAEAWVAPVFRLFRYVRPGEMHQAFNFAFLVSGFDAQRVTDAIQESLDEAAVVGATNTWVLSNHDTVRHVSRFGLADPTSYPEGIAAEDEQPDHVLGRRRARAAAMVELGLPGSAYLYQGDELGLPDHTTLADEHREDPTFHRTRNTEAPETGRDGCRVPMPWRAEAPGYGFAVGAAEASATPADPWLPQPEEYRALAADQQVDVAGSTFELYRELLTIRGELDLGTGAFEWSRFHDPAQGIVSFTVTTGGGKHLGSGEPIPTQTVLVLANMGASPTAIPEEYTAAVFSDDDALVNQQLAPDSAAWFMKQSAPEA